MGMGDFFKAQIQLGLCLCPISVLGEEVEELGCGEGSGVDHEARMETSHHGSGHCWEELALALICLQPGAALMQSGCQPFSRPCSKISYWRVDTKGLVGWEAGLEDASGTAWKMPSC